jgi:hypothetical protein
LSLSFFSSYEPIQELITSASHALWPCQLTVLVVLGIVLGVGVEPVGLLVALFGSPTKEWSIQLGEAQAMDQTVELKLSFGDFAC